MIQERLPINILWVPSLDEIQGVVRRFGSETEKEDPKFAVACEDLTAGESLVSRLGRFANDATDIPAIVELKVLPNSAFGGYSALMPLGEFFQQLSDLSTDHLKRHKDIQPRLGESGLRVLDYLKQRAFTRTTRLGLILANMNRNDIKVINAAVILERNNPIFKP